MSPLPPCEPSRDVGRRALALWAVLLWVLGFEVGPDLHLGMHRASHSRREADRDDDHDHGHHHDHDHGHDHGHDHDVDVEHAGGHGVDAIDPEHGEHAIAHRRIALLVPGVVVPVVAAAAMRRIAPVEVAVELIFDHSPLHERARGPPGAARRELPNCVA